MNWILDADIRGFFDNISHDWMMRLVEHRVGDRRVLRLIRGWLKAGVVEDGVRQPATQGTPQGAVISPLLANIYLHYVYDLWTTQWRKRHARGTMIVVRGACPCEGGADDTVVGFEHRSDAELFLAQLRIRMAEFALELHPEKTRLIEFGRRAASDRAARGDGKPETFDFLGFTHICSRSPQGGFQLARHTRRDRKQAKLLEITGELRRRWHQSVAEQGAWLGSVVRGFNAYHAVPTNMRALSAFRHHVVDSGDAPCAGAARGTGRHGRWWTSWQNAGSPSPGYPIPGPLNASASNTQGGSRMRECRTYGSVRGARSNARPYRDLFDGMADSIVERRSEFHRWQRAKLPTRFQQTTPRLAASLRTCAGVRGSSSGFRPPPGPIIRTAVPAGCDNEYWPTCADEYWPTPRCLIC